MPDAFTLQDALPLVRCAVCGGSVALSGGAAHCTSCGRSYSLVNGALQFTDMAVDPEHGGTVARLLQRTAANPTVYNLVARALGIRRIGALLESKFADATGTVADIGAGTGTLSRHLPSGARYLWIDPDPKKLRGFRVEDPEAAALLADATRLPLVDDAVEWSACTAVSHHLDDAGLDALLSEAARVTRDRFLLFDAVASPRIASRALWRYDRGAHVRHEDQLVERIGRHFEDMVVDRLRIWHSYVLVVARPRSEDVPDAAGATSVR